MSVFSGIKQTENVEEVKDVVGGQGFQPLPSDIYNGMIEMAYVTTSQNGALGVVLKIKIFPNKEDQQERLLTETYYVTNSKGENYYTKDGRNYLLPSYNLINDLVLGITGKPLTDIAVEEKNVKIYDYTQKQEVLQLMPVMVDILEKRVKVCILSRRENKQEKQDGKYVPVNQERIYNSIEKFLFTNDKGVTLTHLELKAGAESSKFVEEWLDMHQYKVKDSYKENVAQSLNGSKSSSNNTTAELDIG